MSNIFKSNSRFSALLDDTKDFKKEKSKQTKNEIKKENKEEQFKYSEKKESRFKSKQSEEKEITHYNLKKTLEIKPQNEFKKEKEQLNIDILSMNNFPELISSVKKNVVKEQDVSYMDILKKQEEIKDIIADPDLVNLQPGWIFIKKDRETGNTIMKYGPETIFYEEPKRSEKEIILDIVDSLVELHEKRTEEYIELNGYDVWEKMFKYPNWEEREAYLYEEDDSSEEDEEYYDEYDEYDEYYDEYYHEYDYY
jgi:hypothetical protein